MSGACDDAMREDELVEALAKRLLDVGSAVETADQGGVDIANFKEIRLAVARECLRQMEWTRDFDQQAVDDTLKGTGQELTILAPLTLAPEDWKP